MSKWKPIETAPNDETILVYRPVPDSWELIEADDNDYDWVPFQNDGLDRPSHWMYPTRPRK